MHRLRNKLIVLFAVATLAPLLVTVRFSLALLERSLDYSTSKQLDEISKTLNNTGRKLYQHTREDLKRDAAAGIATPTVYDLKSKADWPDKVQELWDSG